jgi:hypothetical protein
LQKVFSITDAARRGLYKTSVNTDPNCIVLEKVRVAQTLSLKTVVDPVSKTNLLRIKDAIKMGIVDLGKGVYRNPKTKEEVALSEAIEANWVRADVVKESFEKIRETLVEKNSENEKRNIETFMTITEDVPYALEKKEEKSLMEKCLEPDNKPVYYEEAKFEGSDAKFLYSSKLKNQVTAALIKDSRSNRIIDLNEAISNGIFDSARGIYYDSKSNNQIDLIKAIDKGLVILPDSECLVKDIHRVMDLKSGSFVDYRTAVDRGIVDVKKRTLIDTKTNKKMSLFEALSDNLIKLRDGHRNGLTMADVKTVFDPACGEQISKRSAIENGLLNTRLNMYVEQKTMRLIPLKDAYEKGILVVEPPESETSDSEDEEVLRIQGVYDPQTGKATSLKDAIDDGVLDYTECAFNVKATGEKLSLQNAYERGYLITAEQKPTQPIREFLTGIKKKEYTAQQIMIESSESRSSPSLVDNDDVQNASVDLSGGSVIGSSCGSDLDLVAKTPARAQMESGSITSRSFSSPENEIGSNSSSDESENVEENGDKVFTCYFDHKTSKHVDASIIESFENEIQNKSETMFTLRLYDPNKPRDKPVQGVMNKQSTLMSSIRQKMFGLKHPQGLTQTGELNEENIIKSFIFVDSQNQKEYSLQKAVQKHFILAPNCIINTVDNTELTMKDALSKAIVYFPVADGLRLNSLGNSFFNDQHLFIIYHVLEPQTKHKLTLYEAILKGLLKRESAIYSNRQQIMALEDAIDKGHVAGAVISLRLLHDILERYTCTSNASSLIIENKANSGTRSKSTDDDDQADLSPKSDKTYFVDDSKTESDATSTRVPVNVLRAFPKKYNSSKSYLISLVYDNSTKTHVDFKTAVQAGIYNPLTQEYLNTKKKKTYSLKKAIKRGNVIITECKTSLPVTHAVNSPVSAVPVNQPAVVSTQKSIETDELKPNTNDSPRQESATQRLMTISTRFQTFETRPVGSEQAATSAVNSSSILDPNIIEPVKFDEALARFNDEQTKKIVIISCYDTLKNKEVSYEQAVQTGIYSPITNEYFDTKTKSTLSLDNAVKFGKVKIFRYSNDTDSSPPSNKPVSPTQAEPGQPKQNAANLKSPANEAMVEAEAPMTSFKPYDNLDSNVLKKLLEPSKSQTILESTEAQFDLVQSIAYRVPGQKETLSFRQMIEANLYDAISCKIKAHKSNEYLSLNEALRKNVVVLSDPNIVYDKFSLYFIESVSDGFGNFVSLTEAIHKENLIDKNACTYRHRRMLLTIQIAMKMGLVRGKAIDSAEANSLLSNYYQHEALSLIHEQVQPSVLKAKSQSASCIGQQDECHRGLFERMRVYDDGCKSYVMLKDAIKSGLVDVDNGRIKESKVRMFVPFKEAIINGLISTCAIQHRSAFYMHQTYSYIIDSIYDPRKKVCLSINDAVRSGLFSNGVYTNPFNGEKFELDKALETGVYIIGKKINWATVERDFLSFLSQFKTKVQSKNTVLNPISQSTKQTTSISRLKFAKDTRTGRVLSVQEAVKIGILNLSQGWFKNSQKTEMLDISDAIDRGYLILEMVAEVPIERLTTDSAAGLKKNQIIVLSVVDPLGQLDLSIEDAIKQGLFDLNNAVYIDPRSRKRIPMIDAIDQGLIRVLGSQHQQSIKISVEKQNFNGNAHVKNIQTQSIRYVVDLTTNQIIPIAQAIKLNLVDLDKGFLFNKKTNTAHKITLAYRKGLALTVDDLDNPQSDRCPFRVDVVRNCNTGKELTQKSALTRCWVSVPRRLYINKNSGQEIPLSKAVDMNLIALSIDLEQLDLETKNGYSATNRQTEFNATQRPNRTNEFVEKPSSKKKSSVKK